MTFDKIASCLEELRTETLQAISIGEQVIAESKSRLALLDKLALEVASACAAAELYALRDLPVADAREAQAPILPPPAPTTTRVPSEAPEGRKGMYRPDASVVTDLLQSRHAS